MTNHTPGPWALCEGARHCDLVLYSQNGDLVATVHSIHDGTERRESDAAHLIAAAPELLEALKDLLAAWPGYPLNAATVNLHNRARATIAKAEGRTE